MLLSMAQHEATCLTCEITFTYAASPNARKRKFCSQQCQHKHMHEGKKNPELTERPCETCGKIFRPKQITMPGRFCSRQCLYDGQRGEKGPNWKGGRSYTTEKYIQIQVEGKSRREHQLVMEKLLGRPLESHENVHHKNGQKDDNRETNLELWSTKQPKGQRVTDKIDFALEILAFYRPELLAGA
jgi:endogenous inhibitor of DNA gyrase (YacG/DUF329 family)